MPAGFSWPRIEDATHRMIAAQARPAEDAFRLALEALIGWLEAEGCRAARRISGSARFSKRGHAVREPDVYLSRQAATRVLAALKLRLGRGLLWLLHRFLFLILGLLENDDVLPGEEFQRILEGEAVRFEFAANLLQGHLVFGLDGDFRIFATKLNEDEPAARFQRGAVPLSVATGSEHS